MFTCMHAHVINIIRYSPQPFCPQPPSPDWGHNSHFNKWVQSRHSSSSSGMAGSEAPRFALRCSGLFLVRRFRACRSRQRRFSASAWRRLGDEDVSEFGTNEQRSLLFESATFCLCVCKCMLTDACLYAYVVWVCCVVWRQFAACSRVCVSILMYA